MREKKIKQLCSRIVKELNLRLYLKMHNEWNDINGEDCRNVFFNLGCVASVYDFMPYTCSDYDKALNHLLEIENYRHIAFDHNPSMVSIYFSLKEHMLLRNILKK